MRRGVQNRHPVIASSQGGSIYIAEEVAIGVSLAIPISFGA